MKMQERTDKQLERPRDGVSDKPPPRLRARALKLPLHLRVALTVVCLFAGFVVLLAATSGAPLNLPTERVSKVLGVNIGVPIGLAIGAYLVTQYFLIRTKRTTFSASTICQNLANDLLILFLFLAANYLHFNLKMWVPLINPSLYDDAYAWTDDQLRWFVEFLTFLSLKIRSLLPEDFRWYQFNFLIMFVLIFCRFSATRHAFYNYFAVSMLLMVTLGAASYIIAPALGPFIYEDGTNSMAIDAQERMYAAYLSLRAEGIPWLERYGSGYFTAPLAAMPSLHVGYAVLMTYYTVKARDLLAPLFVLLTLWIFIDSVALRWHYVIDAPVGIALCAFVIWLTFRLLGHPGKAHPEPTGPAVKPAS